MYSICNCFGEFNSIGDIGIDGSVKGVQNGGVPKEMGIGEREIGIGVEEIGEIMRKVGGNSFKVREFIYIKLLVD